MSCLDDALNDESKAMGVPVGQPSKVLQRRSERVSRRETDPFLVADFVRHEALVVWEVYSMFLSLVTTLVQKLSAKTQPLDEANSKSVRKVQLRTLKGQ